MTTIRNTRIVLIVAAANLAVFILDGTIAAGIWPIALLTSLAALTAIYGRSVLRPPVVGAAVALIGLTLVELIDVGALPAIRISI